MKIAYFPTQMALNSGPVIEAFIQGCKLHKFDLLPNSYEADIAVIWSVLWQGRMADNELIYIHYRKQNKPVICIEVGALYRGTTWKIAINNINSNGIYGHQYNLDWDRPRKLGISLAYSIHPDPHIVIAAQHKASLQLAGVDQEAWITEQIQELKKYTDRSIHIRPHPRCRLDTNRLPAGVELTIPKKIIGTYDSFDMHFNCHAVVNYNSGPGIQAAISGVRPIVNSSSLAHPVSINPADIENVYDVDREQWLIELCHTEYTLDEIERGQWVKRLFG